MHITQLESATAKLAAYVSTNCGEPAFLGSFLLFHMAIDIVAFLFLVIFLSGGDDDGVWGARASSGLSPSFDRRSNRVAERSASIFNICAFSWFYS